MRDDREPADIERMIADAWEDARDGVLGAERLESVRRLLLSSPEARRYYLVANELDHGLAATELPETFADKEHPAAASWGDAANQPRSPARPPHPRGRRIAAAALVAAAATALIVLVTASWLAPDPADRASASPIASLEHVSGHVVVTDASAAARVAESGLAIRSGDTIRTSGGLSSAVVVYRDGTRLKPVGSTSLTVSDRDHKSIVMHFGTLFASVVSQPADRPLLVATPQDNVLVEGTSFCLGASPGETDLSVRDGVVRLTRIRDGRSVEVPAGQRVVSNVESELALEEIPAPPDQWQEDFEGGVPDGWESGAPVSDDLPNGSRGAVRSVRVAGSDRVYYSIATPARWAHGLFAIHDDTHLHITFRIRESRWINVFVLTRTDEEPPAFASNYIYDAGGWWGDKPGAWHTVTIPLSEFRRLSPGGDGSFTGELPFQIAINSPEGDPGLVIDRIWVTRDGPGAVEVSEVR